METLACPDCDLLQQIPTLDPGSKARCARCGYVLAARPPGPKDLPLALTVAAAILLVVANVVPLMDLSVVGRSSSTTIAGGAWEMWQLGEEITGALVAFCVIIAPAGYVLFMLTLLLASRRTPVPQWVGELLRWASHLETWSMLEVMALGVLVALVKIAELAEVIPGIAMYAVGALLVLIPAILVTFDAEDVWDRVVWADGEHRPASPASAATVGPS